MSDEQAGAEQFDEDTLIGDDEVYEGDEVEEYPPDHLSGVPFADADVTDESLTDRTRQMEPEQDPNVVAAADEAAREVEESDQL